MIAVAGPVSAELLTLTPIDGQAANDGGGWTMNSASLSLLTQEDPFIDLYRRAVLEFPTNAIPAGATILSATFSGRVSLLSFPPDPQVQLHGYAGDGILQATDATMPFNQVGVSPGSPDLGVVEIPIDIAFVQSLVGTGSHVGLYTFGAVEGSQYSINSVEFAQLTSTEAPALTIEYIPEPATLGLVGLGLLLGGRRRRA
jgi:MYXO-CTERM domain-containing protein